MQTHLTPTTVTDDAEVLTHGVDLVRCPICQTALVAQESCPHGCRIDHRGRRRSPRRGFDRVRAAIEEADGRIFDPSGLEALALAGELPGELVA
jgi:hypothetical protein